MAERRRRILGLNNDQIMHAMGIDDAYHVERVLAQGRNGVTELVTIEGAGPFVRKKMPLEDVNRSIWAALAGADCPRLPQVVATYEMPDCFVAVYDYVPGETLEDAMGRVDALDSDAALQVTQDVWEAIAALHACGVAHLDIAPGNVIIAADGAHLVDFGNARPIIGEAGEVEGATRPKGTWGFAAPEQFFSHASVRSDVFAVGRLLGYMLTGIQPDEKCIGEFEAALRDESRVALPVRRLVERATDFEPSSRPATARELADALDAAARADSEGRSCTQTMSTDAASVREVPSAPAVAMSAAEPSSRFASGGKAAQASHCVDESDGRYPASAIGIASVLFACATVVMVLVMAYKVLVAPNRATQAAIDAASSAVQDIAGSSEEDGAADAPDDGASLASVDASESYVQRAADSLGIVESGWRTNASGYVDYAIVLENTSEDLTIEFPTIKIVGRDASGTVLFSSEQVMGVLFPESTMTFACIAGDGVEPASVEFSVVKPQGYQVHRATGAPTEYSVHDVATREGAYGELAVTGELELVAEGDEVLPVGDVWLSVVFRDEEGEIISGANEFAASPEKGGRVPFSIKILDCPDYATLDVVPLTH